MSLEMVPRDYEGWKRCITVSCRIPLTRAFVDSRIAALDDPSSDEAQRFARQWGDTHLDAVKRWLRCARDQLAVEGRG